MLNIKTKGVSISRDFICLNNKFDVCLNEKKKYDNDGRNLEPYHLHVNKVP